MTTLLALFIGLIFNGCGQPAALQQLQARRQLAERAEIAAPESKRPAPPALAPERKRQQERPKAQPAPVEGKPKAKEQAQQRRSLELARRKRRPGRKPRTWVPERLPRYRTHVR